MVYLSGSTVICQDAVVDSKSALSGMKSQSESECEISPQTIEHDWNLGGVSNPYSS